jgi:hypothetical protein
VVILYLDVCQTDAGWAKKPLIFSLKNSTHALSSYGRLNASLTGQAWIGPKSRLGFLLFFHLADQIGLGSRKKIKTSFAPSKPIPLRLPSNHRDKPIKAFIIHKRRQYFVVIYVARCPIIFYFHLNICICLIS